MDIATFEFKCRRCGEIHTGATGNKDTVFMNLVSLVTNTPPPELAIGIPEVLLSVHNCKDKGYGISDLIGAKPEKEIKP